MPRSYKEYTTGLNAVTYNVPFDYISINDIGALGYDGSEYQPLTIASRSAANKTIRLSSAPSAYQKLRVFRSTTQDQLVDFQSGSRLSESDLDTAYQQALFVAQEIAEDANTTQYEGFLNAGLMGGTSLANFSSEDLSSQVNGTRTEFSISNFEILTTSTEAYRVTIDGIMQSPTDAYTLSANPAKITFADPPPNNSKVIIVTAASAASSSTVDNQTVELFVQAGQSKIRVKNYGIDSLQIKDDAVNSQKIEDNSIRERHLHPDLSDGFERAKDFNHSVTQNSPNFVTGDGIYNAIQALDIGNLGLDAFRSTIIRKGSDNTAHGNNTQLVTPAYVKKVADEVAGVSSNIVPNKIYLSEKGNDDEKDGLVFTVPFGYKAKRARFKARTRSGTVRKYMRVTTFANNNSANNFTAIYYIALNGGELPEDWVTLDNYTPEFKSQHRVAFEGKHKIFQIGDHTPQGWTGGAVAGPSSSQDTDCIGFRWGQLECEKY